MIVLRREPQISKRYAKTREQLRVIARMSGVKRGRNTGDTVKNLEAAGISWANTQAQPPKVG